MPTDRQIHHKSLSTYYPFIQTLETLLISLPSCSSSQSGGQLLLDSDPTVYRDLLHVTLCCSTIEPSRNASLPALRPLLRGLGPSHAEVIDEILTELVRRKTRADKVDDVLLYGVVNRSDPDLPINPSNPSFEHSYINSPSTSLRSIAWKILRSRIGNQAFQYLFLETSLYLALGNNCYVQLCGRGLHELYKHDAVQGLPSLDLTTGERRKRACCTIGTGSGSRVKEGGKKRRIAYEIADNDPLVQHDHGRIATRSLIKTCDPADRTITRGRMFYGSPSRSLSGKILSGLPSSHIMNQLPTLTSPLDPSPLVLLRAIFTSTSPSSALFALPGYVPPSDLLPCHFKLKGSQSKLLPLLAFTRELMARHKTWDYAAAVRRCEQRMDLDGGASGPEKGAGDRGGDGSGLTCVSHTNVERFVTAWMRGMFGKGDEMLGKGNVDVLITHAKSFIRMNQYEPVNVHNLLQEMQKRTALAADLVYWIFNDLLIPLLRNTFYITETASTKYSTIYFLHAHWDKYARPHFSTLETELLEPLSSDDAYFAQHSTLGVAAVRLVPKPNGGFRPIVNLGKRMLPKTALTNRSRAAGHTYKPLRHLIQGIHASTTDGSAGRQFLTPTGIAVPPTTNSSTYAASKTSLSKPKSANQILHNVHQVLVYERDCQRASGSLGNTLFGTNEVFGPIRDLKKELEGLYGRIPQLYFVKMDIKSAFDTIDQDGMLKVVEGLLDKNNDYCILLYSLLLPPASKASQSSARRLFKTKAVSEGDSAFTANFGTHASIIAAPLRNAVLVDLMRRKRVTKSECMTLLRAHIKSNVWQMNGRLLRQRTGIPQGSKISSLLCSFFYAALEAECLGFLTRQPGTKLLRYIDDFLLITPSLPIARRFVGRMNEGFPEYGAFAARNKTLVSFECLDEGLGRMEEVCVQGDWFPYCGFMINMRTLDTSMDHERAKGTPIRQSFSLRSNRHIGTTFLSWFSRQLENRNHVAYLDTQHNTIETVWMNIFLNFALTGIKVPHYFARRLGLGGPTVVAAKTKAKAKAKVQFGGRDEVRHKAYNIVRDLISAIEYTLVAGRARVKHAARLDAKRSRTGMDGASETKPGVNNDDVKEGTAMRITSSDPSRGRRGDLVWTGNRHYAVDTPQFTFLALCALRLVLARKRADPIWRYVVSELDVHIKRVERRLVVRTWIDVSGRAGPLEATSGSSDTVLADGRMMVKCEKNEASLTIVQRLKRMVVCHWKKVEEFKG